MPRLSPTRLSSTAKNSKTHAGSTATSWLRCSTGDIRRASPRRRQSRSPIISFAALSRTATMSSVERAPRILCAGTIVLDEELRVSEFPQPDGKVQASGFFVVNGGCAANAAVAIARLGGRASLAGPMGGPAGEGDNGDRVLT